MINTIRLIRKKDDDLSVAFVIEFLKLVGFMVTDFVIKDDRPIDDSWTRNRYDLDIYLEMKNLVTKSEEESDKFFIDLPDSPNYQDPSKRKSARVAGMFYLEKIIEKLWMAEEEREEMLFLMNAYNRHNMFHYLYNKGNVKYIQEYYPISWSKSEESAWREKFCNRTLEAFSKFYSYILTQNPGESPKTVNFCYAKLSMEYDLNDVMTLMKQGRMFSTGSMLKRVDTIKEKAPDMIRVSYLAGNICSLDNLYLANADSFYMASITETNKTAAAKDLLGFLYYQLGAYYERKYHNAAVAEKAYHLAYYNNKTMMRALYKLAQIKFYRGDYNETIDNTNDIIRFLLNGYRREQAMPGQQLYAYKSFVLMGDAYYAKNHYDLSEKCYQQAVKIANTVSEFYEEYDDDEHIFRKIQQMCMPTQPLYYKIINCASEYKGIDQASQYYEKLYQQIWETR